ncbi:transposase [Lentzea sp. BCCO 10_0061]|uniref:Transposase n=1 Tax=Lentzea sokolovensis TaxID=3095429 RepID=A0ABU4V5U3_9PSEU|nr:transposase [Lentzea sp. BCCO 10_0061]MDX8147099.1 transposase [Lentzea sp. BCCO 10_0061]
MSPSHSPLFAPHIARLDEIPGIGSTAASVIIAQIGPDMIRFPTPAHLAASPRFAPRVLGEAARTHPFFSERHRRIARRRCAKKRNHIRQFEVLGYAVTPAA